MRTWMLVVACVLLAMTASGCGPGGAAAATPKAALENLVDAVANGDADGFVACFRVKPEDKPALEAMGGFIAGMVGYQKAFIDAYGEKEWASMQSGRGPAKMLNDFDKSKLDEVQIKEEGDTATATMPGKDEPMTLVRVDGRWLIDAAGVLKGASTDREKGIKMLNAMAGAIDEAKAKVGASGVSAEDAKKALMASFMKAMMEGMSAPRPE